ncbi:hypothetical protein [Algoriphagus halophilus]|uniref:Uncharacterized protein n=1 Tax=Algoriphagus halophilus TaxID=226505 RepID=A0A1N6HDW4_9BACT|nr:hypothetical protein [Algoriphagus halophilus]SIO18028.1 hypothetical protein SAMN05444394_3772 [Algoriphagus halophilus]
MTKKQTLDHSEYLKLFRKEGKLSIQEGNGNTITILSQDQWSPSMGNDWVYLLFDLFQIRTICEPFSEVSLDIVEFASKPTIYHSKPNQILKEGPRGNELIKFSLIREPNWNKLLFQISQPVLVKLHSDVKPEVKTNIYFPLFSTTTKEMYLGAEGDVKILKG